MTPNSSTINFDPAIPTDWEKSTYYVRDAQGNVMAIYEYTIDDVTQDNHYTLTERNIYGSSRLGNNNAPVEMIATTPPNPSQYSHHIGYRQYELSNHLGNVLAVISDRKIARDTDQDNTVDYYEPDVLLTYDYSPFGSPMPNRSFSSGDYRYGFNGKEMDNEVSGNGNSYDYGFRIYNPRIGKFLSVDPLTQSFPWYTPYQFAGNSPIMAIDLDGLELKTVIHYTDQHADGSYFVTKTEVAIIQDYSEELNGQAHSRTDVITVYKGKMVNTRYLYEPINANEKMAPRPSATYDYTIESNQKKYEDDMDYIFNGEKGYMLTRLYEIYKRDQNAPDNEITQQDLEVLEATPIPIPGGGKGGTKNTKHGDSGRATSKAEKQIEQYKKQMEGANKKTKKVLQKKIDNVTKDAQRKAKGEEHSKANKR